jgi:RNA polymerase sigma-70 factor (ECF subfamily)
MNDKILAVLEDEAIVDLYWNRNEMAITHTDRKYRSFLFKIAHNLLTDRYDSEDCLSDTYVAMWNRIPPARPKVLPPMLSKIVRNVAVDKYRKNSASVRIPGEMLSSLDELSAEIPLEETPETTLEYRELMRILDQYLRSLSKEDMTIFLSRYYCADSLQEIARMLGISQRTVSRRLLAMRQGLRARLEKEGYCI